MFSLYPQLSFEYKLDGDNVIKKTSEELKSDYEMFKSGVISWMGDREEICSMYESTIQKQQAIESQNEKDFS